MVVAVFGSFVVTDYTIENGLWRVHLVNTNPGGGNKTDYYAEFVLDEITATTNQQNLASMIKERLAWTINQTMAPLNTAIANNMTITLP
jgi:hypothetical protein